MKTRIISDSSCDIWELDGVDFATVPLTISTDEKTFVDDDSIDVHEMLDYLEGYKSRSFTACPSVEGWLDAFADADEIYVVTLTSGLSGTFNSALTAKKIYLEKNPDAKVYVVDSLSTSSEQLLIVEKIKALKQAGNSFDEVCKKIEQYKGKTRLFFAFQSLNNFAQNGRVPKVLAQAIGVLGISIIGTASETGTVKPISKCRGKKAVIANLMQQLKGAGYKGGRLNVSHVENEELAVLFTEKVKNIYPDADVNVYPSRGLCAYYGERGGLLIGCECDTI